MTVLQEGQLKGAFNGFKNRDDIFEFQGGGLWRKNEYKHHYHYAFAPDARMIDGSRGCILYVKGIDEPVEVKRVRRDH